MVKVVPEEESDITKNWQLTKEDLEKVSQHILNHMFYLYFFWNVIYLFSMIYRFSIHMERY